MKKNVQVVLLVFLMGWAIVLPSQAQFFFFKNPLVGKSVPAFSVRDLQGKETASKEILAREPSILFFWATWCPHCRAAINNLNKQKDILAQQKVNIVLINIGESKQVIQNYLKKNDIGLATFMDQDQALADDFAVTGLPSFFFIDKEGRVKDMQHQLPDNYLDILSGA